MSDVRPASSRFSSRILGLLWNFQLIITSFYFVGLGLLVGITSNSPSYITLDEGLGLSLTVQPYVTPKFAPSRSTNVLYSFVVINLVMAGLSIILTCLEIVMHNNGDLTPTVFFGFQIFKFILATAALASSALATTTSWMKLGTFNKYYVYVAIGFGGIVL